jgi:hypothetical protein
LLTDAIGLEGNLVVKHFAVGIMDLGNAAAERLDERVHFRVETSDPGNANIPVLLLFHQLEVEIIAQYSIDTKVLVFRQYPEDQSFYLVVAANKLVVDELEFSNEIEPAVHVPEDLVYLWNENVEPGRLVVNISEPDKLRDHDGEHGFENSGDISSCHGLEILEAVPALIVDVHEIADVLVQVLFGDMFETDSGFAGHPSADLIEPWRLNLVFVDEVGILLEIEPEPVSLEKIPVVRRVVVLHVGWRVEALHQQSPEAVALTEIHRPVHDVNIIRFEPFHALIEEHESSLLIVNTFEIAHPPGGIVHVLNKVVIDKDGYSPDGLAGIVEQYPAGQLTVLVSMVLGGIENSINILIQRPDPVGIVPIKGNGYFQEQPFKPCILFFYLDQVHAAKIEVTNY